MNNLKKAWQYINKMKLIGEKGFVIAPESEQVIRLGKYNKPGRYKEGDTILVEIPEFVTCVNDQGIFRDIENDLKVIYKGNCMRSICNLFSAYRGRRIDLTEFNFSSIENMGHMFNGCLNLAEVMFGQDIDTSNVVHMDWMFSTCVSLKRVDLTMFNTHNVEDMSGMFDCCAIKSLNLKGFDTSNVKFMDHMFRGCDNLEQLDLEGFDTAMVTTMNSMFGYCSLLEELNISNFHIDDKADINYMFRGCLELKHIKLKWDRRIIDALPVHDINIET